MFPCLGLLLLVNSTIVLLATLTVVALFKNSDLRTQLKMLRFLSGYTIATFLLNIYMVGAIRDQYSSTSFILSMLNVVMMWLLIYKFWARGE